MSSPRRFIALCLALILGLVCVSQTIRAAEFDPDDLNAIVAAAEKEAASEKVVETKPAVKLVQYKQPSTQGLVWAETFDGDVFARWYTSEDPKFTGRWDHTKREVEAIEGDMGLRVGEPQKFHAISTSLGTDEFEDNKDKTFVISYETKFEEQLECGGAYLKLFHSSNLTEKDAMGKFNNETPYVLMFGPDRCGPTNKVHVIIKTQNPISGEWVEHHLKSPPRVPYGKATHQYMLTLTPDNRYSVYVDGVEERKGFLVEDFEPSFSPAEEIDDPNDKKPEDWVDEEYITDPDATKPDDWDEEAPRFIPDPEARMPEGWMEDEEPMIPDPAATKPEEWDDEEDGEWVAPLGKNPKCADAPGCGKWQAPLISNPNYKGKWVAPKVKNPAYKGQWKPQQIPNPHFYRNESPHALASFNAIGFELWTVQHGALFDNIALSRDVESINRFVDATWKVRSEIEKELTKSIKEAEKLDTMKKQETVLDQIMTAAHAMANEKPMMFAGGACALIVSVVYVVSMLFRKSPAQIDSKDKKESGSTETAATSSEGEETEGKGDGSKSRQRSASRGRGEKVEKGDEGKSGARKRGAQQHKDE